MATQPSAPIFIKNNTGGNAWILLYHTNATAQTQRKGFQASPAQMVGPLTVFWDGTGKDSWSVLVHVMDGPTPGFYVNTGIWLNCEIGSTEANNLTAANNQLTLSVSSTKFNVDFASPDACSSGMTKLAPYSPITHVFVVMLENHSFDNMFAMSGIKGITAATTKNSNPYNNNTYNVQSSAPLTMVTDPGHEFQDVVEQLCGQGKKYPKGGPYPPITNSGFAANYATSRSEGTGLPPPQDIGNIMACFDTKTQLPVLYHLATEFAICDHWYSSMPGPTWPNRFFVHGASSSGLDHSPLNSQIRQWESGEGFEYPNGSIYQALSSAGIPYQFYHDSKGALYGEESIYSDDPKNSSIFGAVPQVAALSGLPNFSEMELLGDFASDLQGPYPYPYTFIEPHYGDVWDDTYVGGSSQHPMDDVYGGEHLLAAVYKAIRNSPYWNTSLLIITYDEHGGFYDCVGPGKATAPADNPKYGYNKYGFDFTLFGVRVPAVVISPLIDKGTVDQTPYDHSSVPKTLEKLFNLKSLTQRDFAANSVVPLLSRSTPRTDCPLVLDSPAPSRKPPKPPMTAEERALIDAQPLPESGNLIGALLNLRKADIELSGRTPIEIAAINARVQAIQTRGDARIYGEEVMKKVGMAREQRRAVKRRQKV